MSQRLCYPYGAGISCTCDARKRILRCVPVVDSVQSGRGPGVLDDGLYDDAEPSTLEEELGNGKGGDERTEIILAATFLLIVILSFIAFIIHRCERNLYQRKHLGCSLGGAASNNNGGGGVSKSLSSVSIQTVPVMAACTNNFVNGEISTISRTVNGAATRLQDVHIGIDGHGHGQYFFRPPSIQSGEHHLSPDNHLPLSPPISVATTEHQQAIYQDSVQQHQQHQQQQYRYQNEEMIEPANERCYEDYGNDRAKM